MTIAQVLQCQEKQIIKSKYNTSLLYTIHTNNVNVKCQFVIND